MIKRNYPHIRLTSQSIRGNYYGAYESNDENAKQGYVLFISHTKKVRDYCECIGWSLGKVCYHLKRAKEIEVILTC